MSADRPAADARAQLAELAATASGNGGMASWTGLPPAVGVRPAAVLILFGVLDSVPADHDGSVVSRDLDVLLLERAATLRSHAGQIAFPGGRVDAGDADPVAAALREAVEETGLDPSGVEVLGSLGEVSLAFSQHEVTPVLAWWQRPSPVHVVDVAESSDVFRAPVADLLDPANRGVTVLRRGREVFRGPAFVIGRHLVWGFTAMLLNALFDQLGWTVPWDRDREVPLAVPGADAGDHGR